LRLTFCPAAKSVIVAVPANAKMARLIRSASGNPAAGQADRFMCDDVSGEGATLSLNRNNPRVACYPELNHAC
jgi:hypothetical protein